MLNMKKLVKFEATQYFSSMPSKLLAYTDENVQLVLNISLLEQEIQELPKEGQIDHNIQNIPITNLNAEIIRQMPPTFGALYYMFGRAASL